jgi:hypothetical protein
MPGELWREVLQIGKETTAGTGVPATRKIYTRNVSFMRSRASRPQRFATGTRDNVRAHTQGPVEAGGSVVVPVSADEIIEWLLMGVQGGVTPTAAGGAQLWVFKPGLTLDSATIERNDGARTQRLVGAQVNQLTIAGSVGGENLATMELFAQNREEGITLTTALTDRSPTFFEGWQTNVYIDNFGGTAGTTILTGSLVEWNITVNNQMGRVYTANNTLAASAVSIGELEISASFRMMATAAAVATEIANWDSDTKRLVRLEFLGPANEIGGSSRRYLTIDLPGAWTSPDPNQDEAGIRAWSFPFQYVYDPALAAGIVFRANNARATAWGAA